MLLLRLLAGGALIAHGTAAASGDGSARLLIPEIAGAFAGLLILGGLWTPVVGVLAALIEGWIAFTQPGTPPSAIMLAGLGISLAMIGPGSWSIDARLYGRKQIFPPEP